VDVTQHLPRFARKLQQIEDDRKLAKILLETGEAAPPPTKGASNGGDWERLRGLPAIGLGVSGAIRGSDPLGEVLRREHRLGRRLR
jgi:hypothetical protein